MRASLIIGIFVSFALSGVSTAETIMKGVSRDDVKNILGGLGIKSEDMSTDKSNDVPWIVATTDKGVIFNVFLYECGPKPVDASQKCGQIQFRMLWDNTKKITVSAVNRFHLDKVFGRGYVLQDGSMIGVEYPMHLEGGVTKSNLVANIKYFLRVTEDFEEIVAP